MTNTMELVPQYFVPRVLVSRATWLDIRAWITPSRRYGATHGKLIEGSRSKGLERDKVGRVAGLVSFQTDTIHA